MQEFVGDGGGIGITQSSEILLSVNRWVRCREIIHATSGEALEKETTSKIDKAVRFSVLLLGNYGKPAAGCTFEVKPSVDSILRAASRGPSGSPCNTSNEQFKVALDDEETTALLYTGTWTSTGGSTRGNSPSDHVSTDDGTP